MLGDELKERMKKAVAPDIYERYFASLIFDEEATTKNIAMLLVPNVYIKNYILANHKEVLANHIYALSGCDNMEIAIMRPTSYKIGAQEVRRSSNAESVLNTAYTFDTFVEGPNSKMAYDLARSCARHESSFNPLLFYGAVGLGKTHLLQAIGHYARAEGYSVVYGTSEQFLNEYRKYLAINSMEEFRKKYRSCDYLLIDDIQFFGGKIQLQEEFFHTFNALMSENKQIVLTSDKCTKDIQGIEERLRSRFEQGINAEITPPDLDVKIKIIREKAKANKIELSDEVVHYLASSITGNVRQIEGAMMTLVYYTTINIPITKDIVKTTIDALKSESKVDITLKKIISFVAKECNIKGSELKKRSGGQVVSRAKKITIYLAKQLLNNSTLDLVSELGYKGHTSISKGYKDIVIEMRTNKTLATQLEEYEARLRGGK